MKQDKLTQRNIWIAGVALLFLVAIIVGVGVWSVQKEVIEPVAKSDLSYTQSDSCLKCHPDHYDSWYETYHRTMTQRGLGEAVQGDFSGTKYTFQGVTSTFTTQSGIPVIETIDTFGTMREFPVVFTVGSRRVQQYVTKIGDQHWRLPLAWNIEEQEWFHLNGGFLHPDDSDFHTHFTQWDANCIFCHNVKPNPGFRAITQEWNSSVAELGIACEACHGPGEEHIARNTNPIRRYFLYYSGSDDPTIVSPNNLETEQQTQLCGHCHGQRLFHPPRRAMEFVSEGDPYTAGDNLNDYTRPIWMDTQLDGLNVDFSVRFWKNGTPRLTAYEYQGILLSKEHEGSDLTCISCHNMHGGDPKGMINPELRTNEGCLQCHEEMREAIPEHTKHEAESTGSSCYSCHMPKNTYGLLDVHPTHHIDNPDPSRAWRFDMPEACTMCHTNETVAWAAENWSEQYNKPLPEDMPTSGPFIVAENIRVMLSGDVVQRSVAVMALAEKESYVTDPLDRMWTVPFFLLMMEDNYPSVRGFAYRGLTELTAELALDHPELVAGTAEIPKFNKLGEPDERMVVLRQWQQWWDNVDRSGLYHPGDAVPLNADFELNQPIVDALWALRDETLIAIGE